MQIAVKSRAEQQFTATQKKTKQAQTELEKARQERADHIAKLKALRLAKEAADRQAAEKAAAEKAAAAKAAIRKAAAKKTAAKKVAAKKAAAKKNKPSALPEVHRRQS